MKRRHFAAVITAVGVGVVGVGSGLAGSTSLAAAAATPGGSMYSFYRSMMGTFDVGSMMGGSFNTMMDTYNYQWMLGGANAPQWMRGSALPTFMMGAYHDPGRVMGSLFANAPGGRVSPTQSLQLGNQMPYGATMSIKDHRITFAGASVHLVMVATTAHQQVGFRAAGLLNPTIVVPQGAQVSIEFINADPRGAQGLVVATGSSVTRRVPMMSAARAFRGSAMWFLGRATSAGLHKSTMNFTPSTVGDYQYFSAVPGDARHGMNGQFLVIG